MNYKPISDLFFIEYGNSLELNQLEKPIDPNEFCINFVSRTRENNGVSAKVKPITDLEPFESGLITVALSGSVLETFLQPNPFYTGYHIYVLRPKLKMTDEVKLFYCQCIKKNKYRYSYGRQANRTLKDILIPSEIPNWLDNLSDINYYNINESINSIKISLLDRTWKWFIFEDIFDIKKGERIVNNQMLKGNIPCIRPIEDNNGVYNYIDIKPNHKANTITVNYNGSVAEAFYQHTPYFALDDVNVLYPKFELNPFIAMFLVTVIRKEKYRFNYGRKWNLGRMKKSIIKLPINDNGNPDWNFISDYIKTLPYSKTLQTYTPSV